MSPRALAAGRIAALAALTLGAPSAVAQDRSVERRYSACRELRRARRDAEARACFESLHAETGEARMLAQVGLADAALGRWLDAERELAAALSSDSDGFIRENRGALEEGLSLARAHLGTLELACEIPGAEARVGDGAWSAPAAVRVAAGTHAVAWRSPGSALVGRAITVAVGETARVACAAEASTQTSPANTPPTVPHGSVTASNRLRPWGIALAAASLGAVAAGVWGFVARNDAAETFNAGCRLNADGSAVATGGDACAATFDRVGSMELVAGIGLGLGGAMLAGGLTLALLPASREAPRATLRCAPGPALSLTCGGTF